MESKDILSPEQIAELLSLDVITVYRMLRKGEMPGVKIGGSWRSRRQDVERLFVNDKQEPVNHDG